MADFTKFFWDKFPTYYHRNDPNKDGSDEGTLERYLECLEDELEAEIRPALEDLLDIRDAITCPDDLISLLHGDVGSLPLFEDGTIDRNLVLWATSIYKLKGTEAGYVLFFLILGYTATLSYPAIAEFTWDSSHNRDDGNFRDTGGVCNLCLDYDLEIDLNGDDAFNDDQYTSLFAIIEFLEPLHSKLRNLSIVGISVESGGFDDELAADTTVNTGGTDDELAADDNVQLPNNENQ